MTKVAVYHESADPESMPYRAVSGPNQAMGRTAGEALDALALQLPQEAADTLVIVRNMSPDRFFSAEQRRRMEELMALRREAIAGNSLWTRRKRRSWNNWLTPRCGPRPSVPRLCSTIWRNEQVLCRRGRACRASLRILSRAGGHLQPALRGRAHRAHVTGWTRRRVQPGARLPGLQPSCEPSAATTTARWSVGGRINRSDPLELVVLGPLVLRKRTAHYRGLDAPDELPSLIAPRKRLPSPHPPYRKSDW